jgi:hypothetical protein
MPTNIRGADVRYLPAAEEDAAYEDHEDVVQEVGEMVYGAKPFEGQLQGHSCYSGLYLPVHILRERHVCTAPLSLFLSKCSEKGAYALTLQTVLECVTHVIAPPSPHFRIHSILCYITSIELLPANSN